MKPKQTTAIRRHASALILTAAALLGAPATPRADTLYVSAYNGTVNTMIEQFTTAGVGSPFVNTDLNYPQGMAFDAGGNLYAACQNANTVVKVTPGGVLSFFGGYPSVYSPRGVAIDKAGN